MAKTRRSPKKSKSKGSRKVTRKSKGPSEWTAAVTRVYKELKSKNPSAKLGDAMREASKRRKAGML